MNPAPLGMPNAQEILMSKAINLAKLTLAFLIIAGGLSIIIGSLMGGGSSRSSYDKARQINKDPRSILVQTVLVEANASSVLPVSLPAPGQQLKEHAFNELLASVENFRETKDARIRTPAILVQHAESGIITVKFGDRTFEMDVSPSVIETKQGDVLRVAIQVSRFGVDSSSFPQEIHFATAYTSASGNSVVLDLAGLGIPGSRTALAIRTTLIDPTPIANN